MTAALKTKFLIYLVITLSLCFSCEALPPQDHDRVVARGSWPQGHAAKTEAPLPRCHQHLPGGFSLPSRPYLVQPTSLIQLLRRRARLRRQQGNIIICLRSLALLQGKGGAFCVNKRTPNWPCRPDRYYNPSWFYFTEPMNPRPGLKHCLLKSKKFLPIART